MDELFDIVSEDDEIIGQAPRRLCHGNPGLIHRSVHVLVFNSAGELLLQKRSERKDIQPGKWDTSVGGHLDIGESYLAAARRETLEELGLADLPLTFLYRSKIRNQVESENIATYLAVTDRAVVPDPAEITAVRFWEHEEIDNTLGCGVFTPNFEEEWRMFLEFCRKYETECTERNGFCAGDSFPDLWTQLRDGLQECVGEEPKK